MNEDDTLRTGSLLHFNLLHLFSGLSPQLEIPFPHPTHGTNPACLAYLNKVLDTI